MTQGSTHQKPPRDKRAIEKQLAANIQAVQRRHVEARIELHHLIGNIPSGAVGSDGLLMLDQIKNAGQNYRKTLAEYNEAVKAFADFACHGTLPEDFKPDPPRDKTS